MPRRGRKNNGSRIQYPSLNRPAGTYQCIIRNFLFDERAELPDWQQWVNQFELEFRDKTKSTTCWHAIYVHDYDHDEQPAAELEQLEGSNKCAKGSHLHVIYRHYKQNGYELGRWMGGRVERRGLLCKFSRIRSESAYWQYLRQGKGRKLSYEKNSPGRGLSSQIKTYLDQGRKENGGLSGEHQSDVDSEDLLSDSEPEESDSGGPSGRRSLDFWDSKKEKLPTSFADGIQSILEIFPALDFQAFKKYVLTIGSPEDKAWYQRFKNTNKFTERVNDEIVEMKTSNIDCPWIYILKNTPPEVFEMVCQRPCMSIEDSVFVITKLLETNGVIVRDFVWLLWLLLDKRSGKRNAIHFLGQVNSGKTLLANSIVRSTLYYACLNKVGKKVDQFCYEPMLGSRCALLNETVVNDDNYEDFLSLTEGEKLVICVKFKPQCSLERTPLILTSNNVLYADCTSWRQSMAVVAFHQRMTVIQMRQHDWLGEYDNMDLHPYAWLKMIEMHVKRSEINKVFPE